MKIWAISDLHLAYDANKAAFETLEQHPNDWLILGGDLGETIEHMEIACRISTQRFAKVFWIPGNHELWTTGSLRGDEKYKALVATCRSFGVITPEDPYVKLPHENVYVVPMFLLYDYTFCPPGVTNPIQWALEADLYCRDEEILEPHPFPSRQKWCEVRCEETARRIESEIPKDAKTILVNHFPLREEHAVLPAIPRFKIWCGTKRTEEWHKMFRATVVVSGHLHFRTTRYRDETRFEEVSFGYPRQWMAKRSFTSYLREIWPGPSQQVWHEYHP